ncbi:MAG: cytochrome c oxidase assembly protein [Candidatus Sericytochromatia bacterium]|nr:cytochrome c oxidase assembly protein [Candidatus Sericytochromatia bacterium]
MNLLDLFCPPAFAHFEAVPVTVSPEVWWEWRIDWSVVLILAFVAALYFRLRQQAFSPGQTVSRGQSVRFLAALGVILIAIVSPIDRIGEEYLFSMHMLQHNLFMYTVPSLMLAGIPGWMASYWLERMGKWGLRAYRLLAHPIIACLLFNMVFTLWHIPFLYDWALRDRMVHNIEHVSMIVTALILWLPLWSPLKALRPAYPVQMLYLVGVAIAQLPVFAFVTFSKYVLYPTYEVAPRLTMLSPLADQQLGGVLMKIVGMIVLFAAFAGVFMAWYRQERNTEKEHDSAALPVSKTPQVLHP